MYAEILNAIQLISAACDGAREQDGQGFNGLDSGTGKRLAAQSELTNKQAVIAHKMLRKYKKQLSRAGVDYDALPVPQPTNGNRRITATDHSGWSVYFEYSKAVVDATRAFPMRRFVNDVDPAKRHWHLTACKQNAEALLTYAMENQFSIDEAAMQLLDAVLGSNEPIDTTAPAHPDRWIKVELGSKGEQVFGIWNSYSAEILMVTKAIPSAKFTEINGKHWMVALNHADRLKKLVADFGFNLNAEAATLIEQEIAKKVKENAKDRQKAAALAQALTGIEDTKLSNGWSLLKHQVEGSKELALKTRAILAWDMGTTKTVTSLLAARAHQRALGVVVYVICPAGLRQNWAREAGWVGVRIEIYSSAKIPVAPKVPYLLIADECHQYQDAKSQRSQKMLNLALSEKCEGVFLLSGTPMRGGRPSNLFPLLKAVKHELAENKSHYEKTYCAAYKNQWGGWDTTGAANLSELKKETANVILRKTKADCLDLPELSRVVLPVELSADAKKTYQEHFQAAQARYFERLDSGEIMEGGEALVLLNQVRHASSVAKVEASLEWGEEVIEQGGQPIYFTEYVASAEMLAKEWRKRGLTIELLTGESKDRQAMVDRFQSGKSNVWISTIKAGGIGLTLTKSNAVCMVDRPWMVDDAEQAESRAHRQGQHWPVTSTWLQANETDKKIDERLFGQIKQREQVIRGERVTVRTQSMQQIAKELAKELFESKQESAEVK